MNKIEFWKKLSNYSVIITAILLIAELFFIKYIERFSLIVYTLMLIFPTIFLISEIAKFSLRRRRD